MADPLDVVKNKSETHIPERTAETRGISHYDVELLKSIAMAVRAKRRNLEATIQNFITGKDAGVHNLKQRYPRTVHLHVRRRDHGSGGARLKLGKNLSNGSQETGLIPVGIPTVEEKPFGRTPQRQGRRLQPHPREKA